MKKWTIGKRITLGFAAIIALAALLSATSWYLMATIRDNLGHITGDALPGIDTAGRITRNAGYMQITSLRHLAAKTPEERAAMEAQINDLVAQNNTNLTEYEKTISRPEDRAAFDNLTAAREAYAKVRGQLFALDNAGKDAEAEAYNVSTGRPAFDAYQKACEALYNENSQFGAKSSAEIEQTVRRANLLLALITLVVIAAGSIFAWLTISGLTKILTGLAMSLADGSTQVAAASGQVSEASQSLAQGSSEQAASLEETSSSLEEMASMTRRNAENAQKANELAKQARVAADRGVEDMKQMNGAMEAIKTSSDDIAKIIKTIDEIAFQTNILALNAAVEAARAGEAGMGFAVVADEVRNLAQRSAQAAKETAAKIEGAIARTGQGVEITRKVAETLNDIVGKSRQVDELVAEVSSASREQSEGITQVNTAVGQMDKVTQSNAAGAEESAAASEELNAQALAMKESVAHLLRLVGAAGNELTVAHSSGRAKPSANGHAVEPKAVSPARRRESEAIPMPGDRNGRSNGNGLEKAKELALPADHEFKDF